MGKGAFILTAEATFSMFCLALLASSFQILKKGYDANNILAKFLIISDVYEVLEKGHHAKLAQFVDYGIQDREILDIFDLVYEETGSKVYVNQNGRWMPAQCGRDIFIDRLIITPKQRIGENKWHIIEIGLCKLD
jgi:hypothetical protein